MQLDYPEPNKLHLSGAANFPQTLIFFKLFLFNLKM